MDTELSPHIAIVLEELLDIYEPFVEKYRSEIKGTYLVEDRLVQSATPLLPLLLTSSTSVSISRRLTVKWCAGVVKMLDKRATRLLCTRLSTDSDKIISTHAKKVVRSIKAVDLPRRRSPCSIGHPIVTIASYFFNLGIHFKEIDSEVVRRSREDA